MIFVDTNYFLRFLLKDIGKQHQKAKKLFEKAASGEIKLFTSMIVFFEIYWVLFSFYKRRRLKFLLKAISIWKIAIIWFMLKNLRLLA